MLPYQRLSIFPDNFFMTGSDFKHVSSILKEEISLLFKGDVKKVNYLIMIPFLSEVALSSHIRYWKKFYLTTFLLT